MGEHTSLLIDVLHEESGHNRLTVAKDSRTREAHLVSFSEKRGLYVVFNLYARALQVLVRLIARFAADEDRVIDGRLEESVTSCRLYFVIPDLLELIICVCGKHTVDEVVCHTLFTFGLGAHKGGSLLAEDVQAALKILKTRLLRAIRAFFKRLY